MTCGGLNSSNLPSTTCRECIEEIKKRPYRFLTDLDIDLIIELEFQSGSLISGAPVLVRVEDLRILREMDKKANLKLKTRFQLLKE
jgi:hypothetical protein